MTLTVSFAGRPVRSSMTGLPSASRMERCSQTSLRVSSGMSTKFSPRYFEGFTNMGENW